MTNFGTAEEYNLFILGNLDLINSDIGGRVAASGDVILRESSIGSQISAEPGTDPSIVIGGSALLEGGQNCSGNTLCADATRLTCSMAHPNGDTQTGLPVDFDRVQNEVIRASMHWTGIAATGTVRTEDSRVFLYGDAKGLNVFSLHADRIDDSGLTLAQTASIDIEIPDQAFALINISGSYIALDGCEITYCNIPASYEEARNTIWHFPQALNWSCQQSSLWGTVIAPHAAATVADSRIIGTAVFSSLTGSGTFSIERFAGALPKIPAETALISQNAEIVSAAPEEPLPVPDKNCLPEPAKPLAEPAKLLCEPSVSDIRHSLRLIGIEEDRIDPCVICGEYRRCKCRPSDRPSLKIRITDADLWS